jgi:methyl-accepting chemotaxis protein
VPAGSSCSRSIQQALGGEPDYAAHLCRQIAGGDLTIAVDAPTGNQENLLSAMRDTRRRRRHCRRIL